MKKTITTAIALTVVLLLGVAATAHPANASDSGQVIQAPVPPSCDQTDGSRPRCPAPTVSVTEYNKVVDRLYWAEQTANEYRTQVAGLTAAVGERDLKIAELDAALTASRSYSTRLEYRVDRQAAKIKRLKARLAKKGNS